MIWYGFPLGRACMHYKNTSDILYFCTNMLKDTTAALVADIEAGKYTNIVITTHHKPDGDAMGSTLGLWGFLKSKSNRVTVVTPTDYSENLFWLPGNAEVVEWERDNIKAKDSVKAADLVFCLDFNRLSRINQLGELVASLECPKVMIDHHLDPEGFEDYAYWNPRASSTCELVYRWVEHYFGANHISKETATCLYTGLMTDTGNFQHNNTTPDTLRLAADLMDLGANNLEIHAKIYDVFSVSRSRLFGYCLYKKMEILSDCRTALIYLTADELKDFDVKTGDTEGLVNFGLGLKDIVLSVLIIDRTERVKFSFRSKGNFAVNEFAGRYFQGGGHKNASGGQSEDTLENAVALFKEKIKLYKDELQSI